MVAEKRKAAVDAYQAEQRRKAAAVPTQPEKPRPSNAKGGRLRTIDSPKLAGLNFIYRLVWKTMYAMADRAPDRTVTKEYREIAQAASRRGRKVTAETTGYAVRYLASIGVVAVVTGPAPAKDHRGHFITTAGTYRVPALSALLADEVQARVRANPAPVANPAQTRRTRRSRLTDTVS